jgi:ATP-binding cassette subfamily B protein
LEGELEVGVYSLMIFMIQRLLWPLTELGKTFDLYQRGMASTGRVLDLLDIDEKAPDGDRPLDIDSLQGVSPSKTSASNTAQVRWFSKT